MTLAQKPYSAGAISSQKVFGLVSENVNRVIEESEKIFKSFVDSGPTSVELDNAKKQIFNNLDTQMKEHRYWVNVLEHLDLRGHDLDEQKGVQEYYQRFTAEQVRDAFKKYYTSARTFRVIAVPEAKTSKPTEKAEPAATSS